MRDFAFLVMTDNPVDGQIAGPLGAPGPRIIRSPVHVSNITSRTFHYTLKKGEEWRRFVVNQNSSLLSNRPDAARATGPTHLF